MRVTISQIDTAIAETMRTVVGVKRVEDAAQPNIDEGGLTEAFVDLPLIQVYWQRNDTSAGSGTDRATFVGGVRVNQMLFHVDVFAKQRGNLAEDAAKALELAEAVISVLEAQNTKPYFGLEGIKAFRYVADYTTFGADNGPRYAGVRFAIEVTVF